MSILVKALLTTQWAIQSEQLALVKAIAQRDDLSALGYADGKPLANTRKPVELFGATAVVHIEGTIFPKANIFTEICGATSVECLVKDLVEVADNPEVKNIVAVFNTPGGSVNGVNEGAEYIAMIQESTGKKITAYVDGMCASAGYWLASQCYEIVTSKTGQLGSIGAVLQYEIKADESTGELLSSRAKNKRPDMSSQEGRDLIQATLDDIEDVFISTASAGRGMTPEALAEAGNYGGILVGQKAVTAGLADRTSNLKTLIDDLNATTGTTKHQPTTTQKGGQMAYETLEEMKADNPVLCDALAQSVTAANKVEFIAAGVDQERARVVAVVGANVLGHENVRAAALIDGTDINGLSTAVINAEQGKRTDLIAGADDSQVSDINAGGETEALKEKPKVKTAKELKATAKAHVAEQAAAGVTVEYSAAVELAHAGEI